MLGKIVRGTNSIKYKFLFANLVLIIAFNILTTSFWNYRTAVDAEVSASSYINEMLRVSTDSLEVALKDIYAIATIVSTDSEVIKVVAKKGTTLDWDYFNDQSTIGQYLLGLFTYKHYLSDILISDLSGRSFSIGNTITPDYLRKQSWYSKIIDSKGEIVVIPPHNNAEESTSSSYMDDKVISVAKPILIENVVVGFVLADVRSQVLNDIFNVNLKNKVNMLVTDNSSGELVFSPDQGSYMDLYKQIDLKDLSAQFDGKEGSFYRKVGKEDVLFVYRYSTLLNWMMVGLVPKKSLLEQFYKTSHDNLLLSLLFYIVAVFVSILVSSFLTKSILLLNRALIQIDKDNLDIKVEIKSKDEIGHLFRQFTFMVDRIKELIVDTKMREQEKRKAEMRALQAQINPHFLYNTLNTIKFLAVLQGADNIRDVSEALSKLMHINMQDSAFITIGAEIEYLTSYLSIQEYKYNNKFNYNIVIAEELHLLMIPKLLLQPIIENAIIHGISPMKGTGALLIKGFKENNCIKFKIQDNGVGMGELEIAALLDDTMPSTGVGLRNVVSRIKMIFGESYGVSIYSENNLYTIVEAIIPVITQEETPIYA